MLHLKKQPFRKKNVIAQTELDCIDTDDIISFAEIRHFTVVYSCPLNDKCCRGEYLCGNHVEYLLQSS